MKPFKWVKLLIFGLVFCTLMLFAFNIIVDPFGVFGDRFINFFAYDMNNNPRVAKIAYLDQHHDEYDSYVIGGSKSSSLSPEKLNQYFEGASFYNMMMYGGDFYDYEQTVHYLVENYEVKNIIVHMSMQEIDHYNQSPRNINTELSGKVLGESQLKYYTKYLTLNLEHGFKKIAGLIQRTQNPMAYATFVPELGVYNKSVRDSEDLGTLEDFLVKYPEFNEPLWPLYGTAIDDNVAALKRIKTYLEEKGINFYFVSAPTYYKEMDRYETADIQKLWRGLASVTDFWDFTGYTDFSYDARNFYDRMHYRNTLGDLMVETMFSGEQPVSDFGYYTTSENVEERLMSMLSGRLEVEPGEPLSVPIVVYHHLLSKADDSDNITLDKFKADLEAYKNAGFTTIVYSDLINYVYDGIALPEKPLIISFDDGYLSNYELAYPLLKEMKMKAVISMIGWSVGLDYDVMNDRPIIPHFTWEQAKEMTESGVIELQSHSFDLHALQSDEGTRAGVLQLPVEDELAYIATFKQDNALFQAEMIQNIERRATFFTYPYGYYNAFTEGLLKNIGYFGSVTVEEGINLIDRNPESLFGLKRIDAAGYLTPEMIVEKILQFH